ncbi:hypothetical protein [Egbenema bharatensis]|uniref:hypothetical protein n=1 Tax=Egbenema bharatensis TaxID=3463334 RepID=UPI003A872C9C
MKSHQTYQQWQNYKELEQIAVPTPPPQNRPFPVLAFLHRAWGQTKSILVFHPEPLVRETVDRAGNTIWRVYVPEQDTSVQFDSPEAVQFWLEERYRRSSDRLSAQYW